VEGKGSRVREKDRCGLTTLHTLRPKARSRTRAGYRQAVSESRKPMAEAATFMWWLDGGTPVRPVTWGD
jgi:hypothetical protein